MYCSSFFATGSKVLIYNSRKLSNIKTKVKVGIIGGSSFDKSEIFEGRDITVFKNTPYGLPSDKLIIGKIRDVDCIYLARHGRKHNILPGDINYRANIWALKEQGCTHILASTALGSLQEYIKPGDIVVLSDFIDRTCGRKQTFYDCQKNHSPGICHLPMSRAFDKKTCTLIVQTAQQLKLDVHTTGTVVTTEGPRYSSIHESNMFRQWEAHVINMTTVPEVVLAKELGLFYASIGLAIGYDSWKEGNEELVTRNVAETFKFHLNKVTQLIAAVVPLIAEENWDQERKDLEEIVQSNIQIWKA